MTLTPRYEIVCTRDFLDVGLLLEGTPDIPLKILARPYIDEEREYGIGSTRWYKTGKFITRSEWNKKAGDMFAPGLVEYYGLKNRVKFDDQETRKNMQIKESNDNMKEKDSEKIVAVYLTKSQCKNLADSLEFDIISYITDCDKVDSIDYVVNLCEAYRKLTEAAKDDTRTSN